MRVLARLPVFLGFVFLLSIHSAAAADYKEGQVWRYKTRPGEENSRLYIVKIEQGKGLGRVYHISLDGLHVANPRAASVSIETISHLPVAETTLDQRLT
jgi:hypothetical protein